MSSVSFSDGERVLCYHGPLLYEAKVLKHDFWDNDNSQNGATGVVYFVHYRGWKQTWDEWVPVTRLLKYDEEGIRVQKGLNASHANATSTAKMSGNKASNPGSGSGDKGSTRDAGRRKERGTKRGRDEDERRPDMKLDVPEILKVFLVDDWEAVTKNNQVVQLPRNPTVVEILESFKTHIESGASTSKGLREPKIVLPAIISGLIAYFDNALGQNLLYRFERPQYADIRRTYVTGPDVIVGQEKPMSAIYGAEHLLRMLVNLPQMIAISTMDSDSMGLVQAYVNELLKFMAENRSTLFVPSYNHTSLQYQNVSKS